MKQTSGVKLLFSIRKLTPLETWKYAQQISQLINEFKTQIKIFIS